LRLIGFRRTRFDLTYAKYFLVREKERTSVGEKERQRENEERKEERAPTSVTLYTSAGKNNREGENECM